MRHRKGGRKLSRTAEHRRALFRNLVTALLERERIRTTDAKAKELKRWADRMVTLGKRGTLAARRRAAAFVCKEAVVRKLFDQIAPRYAERHGGYTRIIKLGPRRGDSAPLSLVELVGRPGTEEEGGGRRRRRGRKAEGTTSRRRAAAAG